MSDAREGEDRDLRDRLRALRVDPPQGEFQAALRRKLMEVGPLRAPSPWRTALRLAPWRRALLWPALGAALGVTVFVALTALRDGGSRSAGWATNLPTTKVAVVRVNLAADVAVSRAHIRVTLPPELSFWADGRAQPQRALEWTQPLRPGDNEIPIAVRGERPGRYRIAVDARIGDEGVHDEIVLEVTEG